MNFKLTSVAIGLALSTGAAQNASNEVAVPTEQIVAPDTTPAAAPAAEPALVTEAQASGQSEPVAEVPSVENSSESTSQTANETAKADFDVLRGRAYNTVGNQAAASTIADKMSKPHEMAGNRLVYLEPTMEFAAVAFGDSSNTYFLGFQNSNSLGLLKAGYAAKSFGLQLSVALGKSWILKDGPNRETTQSNVSVGDMIGAVYSMPLGSDLDLSVEGSWRTISAEESNTSTNKNDTQTERDYWDVNIRGAVSNSPANEKKFSWAAGANVLRHNLTESEVSDDSKTERATLDSRWQLEPFFNAGVSVLNTNNARVLLGLNTKIPIQIYDQIENANTSTRENHIALGIFTSPNLLAELALSDNWLVFGGATYEWNIFSTEYLYENNTDITAFALKSGTTTVNAGVRFQYKNFALEAAISDNFFSNPTVGFTNNGTFIANLGGFINF